MYVSRTAFYIGPDGCLPWPSALRTRDLTDKSTLFVNQSVLRSGSQPLKQNEVPLQPELLPRLSAGSNPIVVTSKDTGKLAAGLLKRKRVKRTTQLYSRQAQILADLLGGAKAIWQLASVVLPSGSGENPNERAGYCDGIHIQAKVLYIDFAQSQQVCFKLTIDTIDALKKHHRALCRGNFEAHFRGNVKIEENVKILMDNFDRAIEHFVHHVDTVCLDEMEKDGSGELTTQNSTNVKSTILELFGPYERYLSIFPELLSSQLGGAFFETAPFVLHYPRPTLQTRNSDTLVSTDATAFGYFLQS